MPSAAFEKDKIFLEKVTGLGKCPGNGFGSFGFVIVMIVNNILSLMDAIEVLLSARNSIGAAYVVRGLYERFMEVAYLLERYGSDQNSSEQRTRCYMYMYLLRMEKWAEDLGGAAGLTEIRTTLLTYGDIKAEKQRHHDYVKWFSLYNGPTSFNRLEIHLPAVRSLYDTLSAICHGKSAIRDYSMDNGLELEKLRNAFFDVLRALSQKLKPFSLAHGISEE